MKECQDPLSRRVIRVHSCEGHVDRPLCEIINWLRMLTKDNTREIGDMESALKPEASRIHVLIPAAGRSTRMGRSKPLLPWGGTTVISQLLHQLLETAVDSIWVLVRGDDESLQRHLGQLQRELPVEQLPKLHIVTVDRPPAEMRDSVSLLLDHVRQAAAPELHDAWMLVPADSVALPSATLSAVIQEWRRHPEGVLVPVYQGKRGHPTLFRWELADQLEQIPRNRGVNWLLEAPTANTREFPVVDEAILADLDTPDDYRRWLALRT